MICKSAPRTGSWYCTVCCFHNDENEMRCVSCREGQQTRNRVGWPSKTPPVQKDAITHRCTNCGFRQHDYATKCNQCGGELELTCNFCKNTFSDKDGKAE